VPALERAASERKALREQVEEFGGVKVEYGSLQSSYEGLHEQYLTLEGRLAEKEQRIKELGREVRETRTMLKSTSVRMEEAEGKVDALEKQTVKLIEDLTTARSSVEALSADKSRISVGREKYASLAEELKAEKSRAEELGKEKRAWLKERDALRADLNKSKHSLEASNLSASRLASENSQLQKYLEGAEKRAEEAEESSKRAKEREEDGERRWETEVGGWKERVGALEAERIKEREDMGQMKSALDESDMRLARYEQDNKSLVENAALFGAELRALEAAHEAERERWEREVEARDVQVAEKDVCDPFLPSSLDLVSPIYQCIMESDSLSVDVWNRRKLQISNVVSSSPPRLTLTP
ncbi:hypothetical protein BT69DRAFT_1275956, partial [Atractiella rhizophila]